ncbi:pectin lyase fold/virulence factor [Paraphoma chrysanthemicola]|nr:pectin lyase fold/virulence factor [Paraphoma chrysanthemicola]
MRLLIVATLLGLAVAQVDSGNATISSVVPTSSSTPSVDSSATSSGPRSAITVAADGSGQFTAINAAILAAQNSGIASITVLPGTYSEAVTVPGTATVTIVGATASPAADWSQNQVTIAVPSAALTIGSSNSKGVSLRNLNFINTNAASASAATVVVALRGSNIAFYGCSIISSGITPISAGYGLGFFANSYIEGADKLFYNFPTLYIYGSTIVPLTTGGSVVFSKGATVGGIFSNSTVVIDSSTIQQKSGYTTSGVFLAAPNGAGAVAIYRNTVLGGLIAPAGVHPQAGVVSSFYGEFLTTGAGSYAKNPATRKYSVPLTADQVSQYTIERIYGNAFSPYGIGVSSSSISSSATSSSAISSSAISSSASASAATLPDATSSASDSSSAASSSVSSTSIGLTNSTISLSSTLSASATISTIAASSCSVVAPSGTLVVSKTPGPCEYSSVTSAISALPNDSKPYTIQIGAGTYVEQISITRKGKVTLIGATEFTKDYTKNEVRIEFSSGRLTNLGQNEQTPVIYSKKTSDNSGLAVYNIDFVNTYPQTYNTAALAADFYGANMAAYGCSFIGFQDTLLANKGTQVFSNCYVEGSVDFVWGFSTAYFYQCMLVSNTPGSTIAAQSRATADTVGGYVFDSCMVTYSPAYGSTFGSSFLGRPYSQFSIAVFMNSYIDKHIKDAGWSVWSTSNPQTSDVLFGEYNNIGPGSWQASTQRASFATKLTAEQASKYELTAWIGDTSWLDMVAYNAMPSYSLTGPVSTSPSTNTTTPGATNGTSTVPTNGTTTAPQTTATINAHPDTHNASFSSLTAALASLPNDSTNQTIFMYSGSYNEQVPTVNRPGAPGQSYKDNTVTITYSRGLSISPLPAGHSNAETATFATASNRISLYNINMINTDNLDGATPNYDIGFYGCSDGYQYYESCYIGGAIDFIWGYSKAYFKAITAHSRSSSTAIGGYIFDQCLFTAAPNAAVDLTNKVYLGRPYSQYALVIWSATDPRTDYITFAEYNNVGPSNWENNVAARQSFGNATLLTSDTYPLSAVMASTEWIDMTFWNSIVTPQPAVIVPAPTNITVNGTSVFNGTAPPTAALDAAPTSSKTNATLILNNATDDYSKNQVTIQFSRGNYFHAFNINFRNNNGTQQDIASLGFAVQNTLSVSGNLFTFKTYIEGNVDFIYGTGSGYFLDITASKRAANTTSAGFVFSRVAYTSGVQYGEYHNYGPGASLSDTDVVQHVDTQPFTVGIGSAQTCSSAATLSRTSSGSSSILVSLSSSIASSLPLATAYTTKTLTAKLTASTFTISEPDVTRTSTQKATFTTSITSPDVDNGRTISPAAATTTSIVKATSTQFGVTTRAGSTKTIEGTTTLTLLSTSSPRAVTLTQRSSTTIRSTISLAPRSTKTSTVKAKSSVKSTITATCIPTDSAQRMTLTATQLGSTTTVTITSVVATRTAAQAGATIYTTITSTSQIGKTTTLKQSTSTIYSTSYATREVLSTFTADAVTVSSFKTRTTTQTIVADQQTVYITRSADVTSTIRTTLPVSTSTEYETVTLGGGVATHTVTAAPSTKTVVLKVTSTVVQFTTKTSKGAAQCTD